MFIYWTETFFTLSEDKPILNKLDSKALYNNITILHNIKIKISFYFTATSAYNCH